MIYENVSQNAESNCSKNDKFKHGTTTNSDDRVHEIQTTFNHNGKRSKGPEGSIPRTQADREANAGGKYNKTKDTIYTLKKGY